jgi:hypothetical protein
MLKDLAIEYYKKCWWVRLIRRIKTQVTSKAVTE